MASFAVRPLNRSNRNTSPYSPARLFWYAAIFILPLASCNPTKYVPENEYLLHKNKLKFEKRKIEKDQLRSYLRQHPNKKILGVRFHLGLYNLSNLEKDNWFHNWLRKIGEPPVIYDPRLRELSRDQLKQYIRNKGYFNAEVTDMATFRKQKATVSYHIHAGDPYTLRELNYRFEDPTLEEVVLADSAQTLLKPGVRYEQDLLQEERQRLETFLKNRGYFNFSKEYIYFEVDSTVGNHQVDVFLGIKPYQVRVTPTRFSTEPHRKYRINQVNVFMDFDPVQALAQGNSYFSDLDTMVYRGISFTGKDLDFTVRPRVVTRSNYIVEGNRYRLEDVDKTYEHLSSLRIFKGINIQFFEDPYRPVGPDDEYLLNCQIQLTPMTRQSYTVEVEGTNSSGNLGVAGNFIYQHKNLFRGAEIFDLKFKGAIETLAENESGLKNTLELGAEANLQLPVYLLPFLNKESFVKKYDPKTRITTAYNFQRRPDYTRTIANASFGYHWDGNRFNSHTVNPFELYAVRIFNISPYFMDRIRGTYLEYSYKNVMIPEFTYNFVFNNQNIKRKTDFIFFRFNAGMAGNLLTGFHKLVDTPKPNGAYRLFGMEYAQYVKSDFDLSFHQVLNESNEFVYRLFGGIGYPYGNSRALPFEKKYFSGGANSLRAWHVRSLGPGSYYDEANLRYPNLTGDIKMEANVEYRFKLFWVMEGALFLDAGNVWDISARDERTGAEFKWNRFYREIAMGTGLGFRFDFTFVLFRLDLGMKVRDPREPEHLRWVIGTERWTLKDDFTLQIGIGYPF
ncbi:MAG: BamA/TamA family outer membrane protein [Bacteroidales bacterium]